MDWPLLAGVPENDVRRVLAAARLRTFARGEVLFHEQDPADTLLLIRKGRIALRVTTPLGQTVVFGIVGPGDVIGEVALLGEPHRSATAVAMEETEVHSLHRDAFADLRREHPSVGAVLERILAERIRDLTAKLVEALTVGAETRVLRRLVSLAALYGGTDGDATVPLKQEDLAELAGTTRATVNRVLRDEQKRGAVRLSRGKVTVVDRAALMRRAK